MGDQEPNDTKNGTENERNRKFSFGFHVLWLHYCNLFIFFIFSDCHATTTEALDTTNSAEQITTNM